MDRVPHRFLFLDGLRGIAAISIFLLHTGVLMGFSSAYVAVDMFFVLSGFVIAYAYEKSLQTGLSALRFMTARVIRVYPCYLLGSLIGVAFLVAKSGLGEARTNLTPFWPQLFEMPLMIPDVGGGPLYPANGPVWSLFFELVANLIYGALVVTVSTSALLAISGTAGALLVALTLYYGDFEAGFTPLQLLGGLARVGFGFFLGVALFRWREKSSWMRFGAKPALPLILLVAALFWPTSTSDGITKLHDLVSVFIVMPLVVILGANVTVTRTAGLCSLAGRLSFPLYAIHWPLLLWSSAIAARVDLPEGIEFSITVAVILVLAFLTDRFVDGPARRALTDLSRRVAGERSRSLVG